MSQPTPPRLRKAKAATTAAAVVATAAALTAGVASSAPEALAAHNRSVQTEVELTAATLPEVPKIVGIYGVGPIFWTAQLLGITPENVIMAAGGLTGNTALATTVTQLLNLLQTVSPVDAGVKGPLPSDVYDAVRTLDYTTTGLAKMLGVDKVSLFNDFVNGLVKTAPILNQRRDIILSESLGGLTTSMAYRDMIEAVTSDSDDWAVGVTGQWLIFVNNPSRPGGGLFALATPFTNLFGMNLTTPDAGSYTNADANDGKVTKVLNTSILDITSAYNPLSDVPTTLNPLSWANSAAAGVFLTYLLPDEGNNIDDVITQLGTGIFDGAKVLVDPSGGQGLAMLPGWTDFVKAVEKADFLGIGVANGLKKIENATKFPGTATYITYDSGNLPLLEPLRMVPHLANLVPGVHIPTPLTDSVEDALRKMVNMGYQDVDPNTLERTFDEGGKQAYLWHSPLTPTQQLAANEIVFDALIKGIEDNALNPDAWTPELPGADFKPVVQNAVSVAAAKAMRDALEVVKTNSHPVFDAVETGLAPVTGALDAANAQTEAAIDSMLKVNGTTTNKLAAPQSLTAATTTTTAAPEKDVLKTLGVDKDSLKEKDGAKAAPKGKARHAANANDPVKRSVKETVAKVKGAVDAATKDMKKPKKTAQGKKEKSGAAAA